MLRSKKFFQILLVFVAASFGLATIFAGGRVLAGADPGYIVFLPLLIFNTVMGVIYVAAALVIWHSIDHGKHVAAVIFGLNLLVLGGIAYLALTGSAIAVDSLRAMLLRTFVWCMLFLVLVRMSRQHKKARL